MKLLKTIVIEISFPLAHIFNLTLSPVKLIDPLHKAKALPGAVTTATSLHWSAPFQRYRKNLCQLS